MRYLAVSAALLLGVAMAGCCCTPRYYQPTYAAQQPMVYAPQTLPQTICQPIQTTTQPVCPPGTVPVQTSPGAIPPQAVR